MVRQAVITGLGIVSPIGIGADAFWRAAREGRSGIGRPTLFDASQLPPECLIEGEVRDLALDSPHMIRATLDRRALLTQRYRRRRSTTVDPPSGAEART